MLVSYKCILVCCHFFYVFVAKVNRLCELNVRKLKKLKDSCEKSLMSTSSRLFFKIAEVGLRGFDTPFWNGGCWNAHLLWKPFACTFFLYENQFDSSISSILHVFLLCKYFWELPRTLSEYRSTLLFVPTVSLPLCSMICDWIEAPMRYCKSSACHSQTQLISEISSTKLYSKMTKNEEVQVNLIYLIFNSSIFSGH